MISSISPFRPAVSRPPAPSVKDDPPADPDFSTIDTPEKAAMLPSINPTTFLINAQGLTDAMQKSLALTTTLAMNIGQSTAVSLNYPVADPNNPTMAGTGTIGSTNVTETWTKDPIEGTVTIAGTVGNSQENLSLTAGDDGTHMDGTIGTVDVHQIIYSTGAGSNARLVWHGTIGGKSNHQEMSITDNVDGTQSLHVEGRLGDGGIVTDAKLTQSADQNTVNLTGQGNIAGTPFNSYAHSLTFAPPTPPSPPSPPPQSGNK